MRTVWTEILAFWIFYPFIISSVSIDSLYLDLIHQNLSDFTLFNKFYKDILKDIRQHRPIDTVSSPINVEKIRSNNYDENYLKNSCYETALDLLHAHGYNKTDLKLSTNDIQSLLPAVLYSIENPGCKRQFPPIKQRLFFDVWIVGLILIVMMKFIHLIVFFIAGDHFSILSSDGISKTITDKKQNSTNEVNFLPKKYHLWLGFGFNAFTCGIILGTIIYHLIPHVYEIPNEDFHYMYIFRGSVVLFGVLLFFIVEKLLRFRFEVDEMQFNESDNDTDEMKRRSDISMIQMAKMHGTFHVQKTDHNRHKHSDPLTRLPSNIDSVDEETDLQVDQQCSQNKAHTSHNNFKNQRRNLFFYHIIYDISNDLIYGCGLSTAFAHDRFIGLVLWLMIISEGFRRHSQHLSTLGRKHGFFFLIFSMVFLIFGYVIGGIITQFNQQLNIKNFYIRREYIYSIVYGALFYTALVTLISELNYFGQHLRIIGKTVNQTTKQRRLQKTLILICQNLFLIIGVLIALILAFIWRYYHRIHIFEYVCNRDSSLIILIIICLIEFYSILTIDINLTEIEQNLLYSHLKTRSNLTLFYQKLLEANDIDDITRIRRIINQDDVRELNLEHNCFKSSNDLLNAFDIKADTINDSLSPSDVQRLLPALANVKFNDGCRKSGGRVTWKNILIGLITVTFINCSALCGAIILPFRKKAAFKWILSGFIGLAVGTLTGSGIFHLIPMAFNIPDLDTHHTYLNKALIPMIVIYIYYMRDQLLRIFFNIETIICTHNHGEDEVLKEANCQIDANPSVLAESKSESVNFSAAKPVLEKKHKNGLVQNLKKMKAAGWMIFIGDMLHNFIDGLTLGAAFMVSNGEGLRMSLPIICEEFPHELGDIAVLLSSGLTIGQALIMNFLSACSCYLGFIIGAKLGELEQFHPWIYALAGGMFVYIGLADMIPELVSMGDEIEKDYIEAKQPITTMLKLKILLCQNSGLILGFVIMFLLGKYSEKLENLVKL